MNKFYNLGKYLIIAALALATVKSYTEDVFYSFRMHDFKAPVGKSFKPKETNFSFAAVSDTGGRDETVERIIKRIRRSEASFILYVGDLVRSQNVSHFRWMADELREELGSKLLYAVPGNHDVIEEDGEIDRSYYAEIFGSSYYWFSYGEVLFIGLDSATSEYDEEQMAWFKDVLEEVRPNYKFCVIYSHVPPVAKNWKGLKDKSRIKFANIIKNKKIDLIIAGHVHYFSESKFEGVPVITLPPSGQETRSDAGKYGYVMVDISSQGIEKTEPKYINGDNETDYVEKFFSDIMVRKEISFISVIMLIVGLLLFGLGKIKKKAPN